VELASTVGETSAYVRWVSADNCRSMTSSEDVAEALSCDDLGFSYEDLPDWLRLSLPSPSEDQTSAVITSRIQSNMSDFVASVTCESVEQLPLWVIEVE
jgi:hypothetical protein